MTDSEFIAMRLREAAPAVRKPSRWRRLFHAPSGRPRDAVIAGDPGGGRATTPGSRVSRAGSDMR